MKSKELLEEKYKEELQKEIVNRFDMYCDTVNNCKNCEYNNGYEYQYEDRHVCLAKFILNYYNISRKFF